MVFIEINGTKNTKHQKNSIENIIYNDFVRTFDPLDNGILKYKIYTTVLNKLQKKI